MSQLKFFILLFISLFSCIGVIAQDKDRKTFARDQNSFILTNPLYIGVKAGVPFGRSTFSSFVDDNPSMGYNGGIFIGYSINQIFSVELSATLGKMKLNTTDVRGNNWLGSDGSLFLKPVPGLSGQYYRDMYSSVTIQQYGLHANINLLTLISRNLYSRFSLVLSPSIYGVGTQSTIKMINNDEVFLKYNKDLSFGVGGDLSIGYDVTGNVNVRLSSGLNHVIGKRIDGLPKGNLNYNIVFNNNVSVTWRFGKKIKSAPSNIAPITEYKKDNSDYVKKVISGSAIEELIYELTEKPLVEKDIEFPTIYFKFDKINVNIRHLELISKITELLLNNPSIRINVTGYTDNYGSDIVNKRYSEQRAESVKLILTKRGIEESRIEIFGAGVDLETTAKEARRAVITQIK